MVSAFQSVSEIYSRSEFTLAGLSCTIHSNSIELLDGIAAVQPRRNEGSPGFTFRVDARSDVRRGSAEQSHYRGLGNLVCAMFGDDELFVFDLINGEVRAIVSLSTASDVEFWLHTIFPMTLGVLGLSRGLVPLHSACLARPGHGLLLAGESGAGKSTLAVALAQNGWSLLSDDWTYLTIDSSTLLARGTEVPVKLLEDASALFPELHAHKPRRSLNGELAFEVPADALNINFVSECIPHRLVFIERNQSGKTKLEPCDSGYTASFFLRWAENLPDEISERANDLRLKIISRVASLDCWRLSYSGSPSVGAAAINELGGL
jgi:hypothetical protein